MSFFIDDNLFINNSVNKNNESTDVLYKTNSQMHHTMRHRANDILPTFDNSAEDFDNLDDVFNIDNFIILAS